MILPQIKSSTHPREFVEEIASILKEFNSRTPISNGSIYIALSRTRRSKGWVWSNWVGELELRRDHLPTGHYPPGLSTALNWYKGGTDTSPICSKVEADTGRVLVGQGDHYKMIKTGGMFWLGGSTSSRETSPIYKLQYSRKLYWVVGSMSALLGGCWLVGCTLGDCWLCYVVVLGDCWLVGDHLVPSAAHSPTVSSTSSPVALCSEFSTTHNPHAITDCIFPIPFSVIEML